jgi:hypothetical protein
LNLTFINTASFTACFDPYSREYVKVAALKIVKFKSDLINKFCQEGFVASEVP